MSEIKYPTENDDTELAEIVAEIGERLRRGESVRPEDYDHHAETLVDLLPTIRMMADLPSPATPPGELGHLGDFRLIREVSRGGMGVVYEAVQVSLGRRVALKVLPNAAALDPRHLHRFQVEAQAAASLNHPHIVPVFATGSAEGIPYYAMRFIDGSDLARVIRESRHDRLAATEADRKQPRTPTPLSTQAGSYAREVARLAMQAANAFDHAHANDVLHRDIKPSNLLIDHASQLWITDFGLARVRGGLDLTHTGDALGTPRYMSPEQALERRTPLDGRTDIYSLGVTLYELLTLRPAFFGEDRLEVLRQIVQDEPIPLRKLDPAIPADLETIVLKAMAKSPADRYNTAADLAADLGRYLENRPILARRPSLADQGAKWVRRHRTLIVSATAGLLLFIMGLAGAVLQYAAWLTRHNAALQAAVARADQNAREAEHHASEAGRQRKLADRHFLAAQLRLAQQAIEARQFEVAQDLLDAIAPDPRADDTGEFAWHYLRRLARRELVRLPARAAQLGDMALAGDGQTAAVWYNDAMIVLWDLASECPIRTLGPVKCRRLVLSEDGRILAAEQGDLGDDRFSQITAWDTKSGRTLGQFPMDLASRGRPSWLHLLAGGRVVASRILDAGPKYSVRLHSLEGVARPSDGVSQGRLDGLNATCFLPGADFFVTRKDSRLRVHDAFTGRVRRELPGTYETTWALAISGDGRWLATNLGEDSVVVLDLVTGAERVRHRFGTKIAVIALGPDGNVLAAVDWSGLVHVWNRTSGRSHLITPDNLERGRHPHHPAFSPDGSRLATNSSGEPGGVQPVAVWDVASGQRLGVLPSTDLSVEDLGFTRTSRALITCSHRAPRIWHFDPSPDPPSPAGHKDEAWAVTYSPDGKLLATGSDDTDERLTIKLWNPATGELLRGWSGGNGTVASLAFSPDGRILASGHISDGKGIRLWDVSTGSLRHALAEHSNIRSVAFAPDGRTLATAGGRQRETGQDWKIRLWDVATGRCIRDLSGHTDVVRSLAFSPDGRTLATASNDQTVRLWDAGTGRLLQTKRGPAFLVALAFAPGSATLMTADDTGLITIHDASSLEVLKLIRGESDKLLNLTLAPDGRALATCGKSGTIHLWDTLTGQELLILQGHKAQVNGIAFAPDGSSLASCSHDGEVKLWRARSMQDR